MYLFITCTTTHRVSSPQNFTENYLLEDIGLFNIEGKEVNNPAREWFFADYKMILPNIKIYSGYYPSEGDLMVAHMFTGSDTSKGTIIVIHGYNGTSRNEHFEYLAQQLIPRGFRFIVLNLPGHEFSGGYRGTVESFAHYRLMLKNFLLYNQGKLGEQIILVGHSVGAITIYDSYVHFPEIMSPITATVLLAPFNDLKNSEVYSIAPRMVPELIDKEATALGLYSRPTSWITKEIEWTARLKDYNPVTVENMLIIFGSKDKIIKSKKSIAFFNKQVIGAETRIYVGQNHTFTVYGIEDDYLKLRTELKDWILSKISLK